MKGGMEGGTHDRKVEGKKTEQERPKQGRKENDTQ